MEHLLMQAESPEAWLRQWPLEGEVLKGGRADQDNYSALVVSCTEMEEMTQMPSASDARFVK